MEALGINITVDSNANNSQIIQTVVKMLPMANKQMANYITPGSPLQIIAAAQKLPKTLGIQYKADGFNQRVQLPSSLINTKIGDCKSFSLLIAGYLSANNIQNGIVFVGYGTQHYSHVYNFAIVNGKTYYIDGTIQAQTIPAVRRKETITKKFMNLQVVAGVDLLDIGKSKREKRRERRKDRREDRKERREDRRENRQEKRKERGSIFKRAALTPARGALLSIMLLNVRGIATRTLRAIQKNENTVKRFWNRLGGNYDKFKQAVERGAKKRPVNGVGMAAHGVGFTELISVAGKLLKGLFKLFDGMGVKKEKGEDFETLIPANTPDLGTDIEIEDPEPGSNYQQEFKKLNTAKQAASDSSISSFQPSTIAIAAGAGLLSLLLFSSKK